LCLFTFYFLLFFLRVCGVSAVKNFMEKAQYPFLILTTGERFPRLLVTRRPDSVADEDTLYGAFLPETKVRLLIDLIARVFRLHPCELDIDGSFDAPCPEYFLRRCLAPCVAEICDDEKYQSAVEAVHLLLSARGDELLFKIDEEIALLAENLEFERAAEARNTRRVISEILNDSKWRLRAEDFIDVLTADLENGEASVHLNTLRRGKMVGGKHFVWKIESETGDEGAALAEFIKDFYRFYLPKRIYVSHDFPARKTLEKHLSNRFGKKAEIIAELPEKLPPTVLTARKRAEILLANPVLREPRDAEKIGAELKEIFNLNAAPRLIECFDVAHLAGKEIVAARVIGRNGKIEKDEQIVWHFENLSETESMAESVRERLKLLPAPAGLPDLILLDGGKPQLNAARKVLREFDLEDLPLVSAVKPARQHNKISHFLTNFGEARIDFDSRSGAMNFLQKLRDEAHALSNRTHREVHSLVQIFDRRTAPDAPKVQLLLVPTRYAARGGQAEDLAPIRSLNQSGEVLLKAAKNQIAGGAKHKRRSRFSRKAE
jgi:excinuclease ABC subunit C